MPTFPSEELIHELAYKPSHSVPGKNSSTESPTEVKEGHPLTNGFPGRLVDTSEQTDWFVGMLPLWADFTGSDQSTLD